MSKVKFTPEQIDRMEWCKDQFNDLLAEHPHFNNVENYEHFTNHTRGESTRGKGRTVIYTALGLCGEAGEVADKIKKVIRDNDYTIDEDTREAIAHELGDVQWYIAQLARDLGYTLTEIMKMNMEKLFDRAKRRVISGEGDNR